MKTRIGAAYGVAIAALGAALALMPACSGGATLDGAASSALASAVTTATTAAGALACAPTQTQLDACSGKAAGDACALSPGDGGASYAGTCRATIDGSAVACAPNPPAPPQAAVDACSGKAAGDSCTTTERDGDTHAGVCAAPPGQSVLACARQFTPPQVAVDACAGKAKGDACALPDRHDAGTTIAGTCGFGPMDAGTVLACAPAGRFPDATAACSGKAAGAACTLSAGHESATGTCTVPSGATDPVCLIACGALGGGFGCHGDHRGPGPGPGDHH